MHLFLHANISSCIASLQHGSEPYYVHERKEKEKKKNEEERENLHRYLRTTNITYSIVPTTIPITYYSLTLSILAHSLTLK